MAGELTFRPGLPEDLPEVARICAHTWDWGDYIPEVWEHWLADERGHVAVAELEGQVVALGRVLLQPGGQAWLDGMRVDGEYRRQGIAWRFFQYKLAYARAHGARVARLGTADSNKPVHGMMARAGVARVGRYELLTAGAQRGGTALQTLSPGDAGAVAAFLGRSPVLAAARGLYCLEWAWEALSPARTAELLAAGQVLGRRGRAGSLEALAVVQQEPDEERLWVGFADAAGEGGAADAGALRALARELQAQAGRRGLERVVAMLADEPQIREAFRAAGYQYDDWEGELWIYELPLAGADA